MRNKSSVLTYWLYKPKPKTVWMHYLHCCAPTIDEADLPSWVKNPKIKEETTALSRRKEDKWTVQRLVDVDWSTNFECSKCVVEPSVFVCDGVM